MAKSSLRTLWAKHLKSGKAADASGKASVLRMKPPFRGRVLGIDPSLRGTGFAVIDFRADGYHLEHHDTLRISQRHGNAHCLGAIARTVTDTLAAHDCDVVAIEETIYVQNFRTAQILGAARGSAIGTAAMLGKELFEYSPLRIKQAVAGYGRASKEQVARQVQALLRLKQALPYDESDAAAVALCHALTWQPEQ